MINAINGFADVQFHDPMFALRELQNSAPEIFEDMDVDLENGMVTVKGVENHLRRIAKEKDWAVKKAATDTTTTTGPTTTTRPSGAPPAGPANSGDKAARRKALADKFPVIAHGRKF